MSGSSGISAKRTFQSKNVMQPHLSKSPKPDLYSLFANSSINDEDKIQRRSSEVMFAGRKKRELLIIGRGRERVRDLTARF